MKLSLSLSRINIRRLRVSTTGFDNFHRSKGTGFAIFNRRNELMSVNKVNPVPRNSHQSWNRRTIRETDFPNSDRARVPCHPCPAFHSSLPSNISPIIVIRSQSRGVVHISGPPSSFSITGSRSIFSPLFLRLTT